MTLIERHTEHWQAPTGPCPDDPVEDHSSVNWRQVAQALRLIIDKARETGDCPADPDCTDCDGGGRVGEQGPEGTAITVDCPRCFP